MESVGGMKFGKRENPEKNPKNPVAHLLLFSRRVHVHEPMQLPEHVLLHYTYLCPSFEMKNEI